MKSRSTFAGFLAIPFAAATVAFVVVVMFAGSTRAGEIEHGVIMESWDAFTSASIETGDDTAPFLADILEIAGDTTPETQCETLASGMAFYIATYQDVVDLEGYDPEVYSAMVTATDIVFHELDRLAAACLEE